MDSKLLIRRAQLDDAGAVAALLEQLGYHSTPTEVRERLAAILSDPDYGTWVAQQGSHIIGLVGVRVGHSYEKNGMYGQLLVLVVDAGARRGGVGAELVRVAEEWIRGRGGRHVILNSGRHRLDAHRFYERMGYTATGLRFVKSLESQNGPGEAP